MNLSYSDHRAIFKIHIFLYVCSFVPVCSASESKIQTPTHTLKSISNYALSLIHFQGFF